MFGHFIKKLKAAQKGKSEKPPKEPKKSQQDLINEKANQAKEDRKQGYSEGRQRVQDLYNDPTIQGLDPEKKKAMQYAANQQIHRGHQAENRKLLGEQSQRGIQGKGGVGFAQQKDLQRLAMDAENEASRDITNLDADLRLKNIAAIFAGEQGEAAQNQLDKQLALDELRYDEERKHNRKVEKNAHKQFSRI